MSSIGAIDREAVGGASKLRQPIGSNGFAMPMVSRQPRSIGISEPKSSDENRNERGGHGSGSYIRRIGSNAGAAGDVIRNVFRPALGGVEGDDAERLLILPLQQIHDDGFEIGVSEISFGPDPAEPAEVVGYDVGESKSQTEFQTVSLGVISQLVEDGTGLAR